MSHSTVEVVCLPKAYRRYKTKHLKPTETHTHVTRDPPWAIHSDTSGSVGVWRTKGEGSLLTPWCLSPSDDVLMLIFDQLTRSKNARRNRSLSCIKELFQCYHHFSFEISSKHKN
ncbi:hypothetical protein CEXT_316541 [Caerostris extrusa]|uniref:Uncharacterized protein n=1 Tax=Caerostris extrusa TaxID=172846 RepID=A0AAV4TRJ8_CAEEX|nr:hypothetical protein CEXT_316541 [Caerostris extrusa]